MAYVPVNVDGSGTVGVQQHAVAPGAVQAPVSAKIDRHGVQALGMAPGAIAPGAVQISLINIGRLWGGGGGEQLLQQQQLPALASAVAQSMPSIVDNAVGMEPDDLADDDVDFFDAQSSLSAPTGLMPAAAVQNENHEQGVIDGDTVYIKLFPQRSEHKEYYLSCHCVTGTYCSAIVDSRHWASKWKVEFGVFEGNKFIRFTLQDADQCYVSESYPCLYASTPGSAKLDRKSSNTKQMWVLNSECDIGELTLPPQNMSGLTLDAQSGRPLDRAMTQKKLFYGRPYKLMDRYVFSYLCANMLANVGSFYIPAEQQSDGHARRWVEAKYERHLEPNFEEMWVLEKAE